MRSSHDLVSELSEIPSGIKTSNTETASSETWHGVNNTAFCSSKQREHILLCPSWFYILAHFSFTQVPVIDLFWPAPLAPGLEQLVTAIDQLDFWLHNHDSNGYHYGVGQDRRTPEIDPATNRVAVLHCTGPRSLLATYLAVYICQSKARFGPLCGQRPGSPTARGLQWNERRFRRQVWNYQSLYVFLQSSLLRIPRRLEKWTATSVKWSTRTHLFVRC